MMIPQINYKIYCIVLMVSIAMELSSEGLPLKGAFRETFDSQESEHFVHGTGGHKSPYTWELGSFSLVEEDTKVLRLTVDPSDAASPWQGPNAVPRDKALFHYGTYMVRLKTPSVEKIQPNVGMVAGFFTYQNDRDEGPLPKDLNQNGLSDNSEIDIEWLVADPRVVYLTAYTDVDAGGKALRISRVVNLADGLVYSTEYLEEFGGVGETLNGNENQPETIEAIAGFDASSRFYTYGFDWFPDSIRWWIIDPESGNQITLWHYQGNSSRITQKPASLMLNLWHTNNWPVVTNPESTQKPEHEFSMEVDWVSYAPFGEIKHQ